MRVNTIETNNTANTRQQFTGLLCDRCAKKVIDMMPTEDIVEFNRIKKSLSKTKNWDLRLSSVGRDFKNFVFNFANKINKQGGVVIDDLIPYRLDSDSIVAYTTVKLEEGFVLNTVKSFKFESAEKAKALYDAYEQHVAEATKKYWVLTPLENLKNRVVKLKILEESVQNHNFDDLSTSVNSMITTKTYIGNGYK